MKTYWVVSENVRIVPNNTHLMANPMFVQSRKFVNLSLFFWKSLYFHSDS